MAKEGPAYKVGRLGVVDEQIEALSILAADAGMLPQFTRALRAVIEQLQTRPLEFGDPQWSTHKEGGTVLHGILRPVLVRYVVYEPERRVCILKVIAWPDPRPV